MFSTVLSPFYSLLAEAGNESNFFKDYEGYLTFAAIIGVFVLSWFLGSRLAAGFRMKEYATRLTLMIGAILVSTLIVGFNWPPKFGVDLRGGINMIGSFNFDSEGSANVDRNKLAARLIPILQKRIDPSGTREIVMRPLGDDKIEIIIPDVDQEEAREIWQRLIRAGQLQFRVVASSGNHKEIFELAEKQNASRNSKREVKKGEETVARWISIAFEDMRGQTLEEDEVIPYKYFPGSQHFVRDSRTLQTIDMRTVTRGNDPKEHGRQFAEWCKARNIRNPQILVLEPKEKSNVEGKDLSSIQRAIDEMGRPSVSFNLYPEGGRRMGRFTSTHTKSELGIVIDGKLHSAPVIQEPIYDSGRITGQFSDAEINELVINLQSGKLDVALNKKPISEQYIESSLGEELKQQGLYAIGISLIIVLAFMIVYYKFAGVVATAALLLNLLLIFCFVMLIGAPLTLTGLAGLVLTVGMSVDANVLIFERIREEIDRGSAIRMAIRNGFDKATVTIVDANLTTLITALVLYVIGTEQIKGFAVTLILGILMSMFTAIYCSRAIFDIAERRKFLKEFQVMRILSTSKFDFLSKRMLTGAASVILIMVGIGGIFSLGAKILDHDLRGGSTAQVVFKEKQDVEAIRKALADSKVTFNDEQAEFTVSKISRAKKQDDNSEDIFKDRVFKIDSSIPTWDKDGDSPYKELPAVLQEVFGEKLARMNVQFNIAEDEVSLETFEDGRRKVVVSALKSVATSSPQEEKAANQDTTEKKTDATETEDAKTTNENSDSADSKKVQETEETKTDNGNSESNETKTPSQGSGAVASNPLKPEDGKPEGSLENFVVKTIKTKLDFEYPITGKSIKTLLSEAARRSNFSLQENQISVDTADATADENADNVPSKSWTVNLEMSDKKDVEAILSSWQSSFNTKPYFPTSSGVGSQIARDTQWQAFGAIFASLIGIIAYVWIRFQNVAFGLAAVIALIHDVLIVLGAIALSHYVAGALGIIGIQNFKISLPIIAALLTIIGYSLNDTIVVFDRIREVRGKRAEITEDMINTSISQTLSRTILTSLTTFIVVFILYVFGGDAIHGFAFALVIGVIVGTYSSIFVASPSLLWLMNTVGLNPGSVIEED